MGADLITIEEYKASTKIESLKNDDQLNSLIPYVSQLVKTYCSNSFVDYYSADKVELFTLDYDTNAVQVHESPLVSVTKVEERATYDAAYTELTVAAYEYYPDFDTDVIFRTAANGFVYWAQGPGSVQITYKAGYDETPLDLRLAIIDLVTYYFKDEYKERRTIGGSSMSNSTTSTQWRNVGFPDHIKRVLDLYKQVEV